VEATPTLAAAPPRIRNRRTLIVAASILLAVVAAFVVLALKWPFTEGSVRETLEHRFARQVVIHGFHQTWFPPGCIAEDVEFLHRKNRNMPPLISVKKLIVRGSYAGLLPFNKHIPKVEVVGLHVTIPPQSSGGASKVMPLTDAGSNVPLNDLQVDGALLEFRSSRPGKQPFKIVVHKLVLDNVGGKGQIAYHATLKNTEPPGEIRVVGQLGPWDSEDPGGTPLSGIYSYTDVDLGVFGGISGKLSSQGKFDGTLARLKSEGSVEVKGFHIAGAAQTVHLSSQFQADVDAVNGNTSISDVRGAFLRTIVFSKGTVEEKTAAFEFNVSEGRIEDFLRIFCEFPRPAMTGRISLHAKAELPSGSAKFLTRLQLEGDFGISVGRFTNAAVQSSIDRVSDSARGENRKEEKDDPTTALSGLKGHVSAKGGVATLSNISFAVPGGSAQMHGTFNLLSKAIDIHGVLYTDGKLSDGASGFKALLLKAVSPLLKKRQQTTIVPFTITGTAHHPSFALDIFGRGRTPK
jgi:hypothetical protein